VLVPLLVSTSTPIEIFAEQYVAGSVPGVALLAGGLLATAATTQLAAPLAALLVAAIPFTAPGPYWPQPSTDPWREALGALRAPLVGADDLVLVATDFPESHTARFEAELEPGGMLLSPLAAYPVAARALGVASVLNAASEDRLARLYERERIGARDRFFLLQRERDEPRLWFLREHPELEPRVLGLWGALELIRFEPRARPATAPAAATPDPGERYLARDQ
jgi:hypothetical protein